MGLSLKRKGQPGSQKTVCNVIMCRAEGKLRNNRKMAQSEMQKELRLLPCKRQRQASLDRGGRPARLSKAGERKGFPGGSQQPLYKCHHETLAAKGRLQKTLDNIGLDPNFFFKKINNSYLFRVLL